MKRRVSASGKTGRRPREAQRLADEAEREAERRAKEAKRERERLEREQVQLTQELRLSLVEEGQARELEVVRRALEERQAAISKALAKGAISEKDAETARTLATEVAEANREQIRASYRAQAFQANQRRLDAEADLDDRQARVAGATEEEVLQARLDRAKQRLALARVEIDTESDYYQQLVDAVRSADLDIAESAKKRADERIKETRRELDQTLSYIDKVLQEQGRLIDEQTRDAERALEDRTRAWEKHVYEVLDTIEYSLTRQREFSEEDVDRERRELAASRRELEDDYERRQISTESYHAQRQALAAKSAEFEAQVAEDSASRVTAALQGIVAYGRQAALDFIKQEIAKAVAAQIVQVVKTIPFPLNLLAVGGAVAATYALEALIPEFATGGYTGQGHRYQPAGIVHADEFVFTQAATRGNVQGLYALMALLERGVPLGQILPGYDVGGIVRAVERPAVLGRLVGPTQQAQIGAPAVAVPPPQRDRKFEELVEQITRLAQPRAVSAKEARRIERQARLEAQRSRVGAGR